MLRYHLCRSEKVFSTRYSNTKKCMCTDETHRKYRRGKNMFVRQCHFLSWSWSKPTKYRNDENLLFFRDREHLIARKQIDKNHWALPIQHKPYYDRHSNITNKTMYTFKSAFAWPRKDPSRLVTFERQQSTISWMKQTINVTSQTPPSRLKRGF